MKVGQKVAAFAEDPMNALKQLSCLQARRSSCTPASTAVINEENIRSESILTEIMIRSRLLSQILRWDNIEGIGERRLIW